VHFPGIAAPSVRAGVALVSAMSSSHRVCIVSSWSRGTGEEQVSVNCYNLSGTPSDSRFTVNYLQEYGVPGHFAYAWIDTYVSLGTSTPHAASQYDGDGGTITVNHTGTGRYGVKLPNLASHAGVVLVSPTSFAATCRFSSTAPSGADVLVGVTCRNLAGSLKNTRFTIAYFSGSGLKGPGATHQAYVFGRHPTTATYEPAASDRYSTSGQVPTIQRTGTGKYVVTLPGQNDGGGAQATAMTDGSARCIINYIRTTSAPAQIGVGCYVGDGVQQDEPFSLAWAR
jgi:hypothetical protein